MRIHNPFVTGSLTVSGSKAVDFSDDTGGVSGSFSGSFQGSMTGVTSESLATRATSLEAASASFETNKATKGFSIAMSVAL